MLIIRLFICCLFLSIPSLKSCAQDQTPEQLVSNVQSSLVEVRGISTRQVTASDGQVKVGTYHSQGSGVIIDTDGIIVTNTHIITNAAQILVGLSDGKMIEARVVYKSDADFCLLKIDPPYPLRPISWADSSQATAGTTVIALTNGGTDDESTHIVSGAITDLISNPSTNNVEAFELDLDLYHGDSGGPLLDQQGQLLGLIMGKENSESNKSFAIASNKIQEEYRQFRGVAAY